MENLSTNVEYFRVIDHLRCLAEYIRNNTNDIKNYLKSAELEHYGARNINNGSGKYVIVF